VETTSKFRANLRRRHRNLEVLGKVELKRVEAADRTLLEKFYQLESAGWKGRAGSAIAQSAQIRQYYDEIAGVAARLGMLTLYVLEHNGEPIAMQYGLTAGGRYFISKPAYDEKYREYSPGQLLMDRVITDCRERGLVELDFLGMAMPWKLDWTKKLRRHQFCYVFRNSAFGSALRAAKFELAPIAKHALEEAHLRRAA
jgi:CelD/BcsL family acetyltransferase involved in cellulose biosynthesis